MNKKSMYTEIWHTCFFYLTKRFYEKILFEPDHIARKLFCNEHVKIKILKLPIPKMGFVP